MRQAVVIIHGIGGHRPMETLRAFVSGVFGVREATPASGIFSKPDRISDTLELRRLHVPAGNIGGTHRLEQNCETDFYELYWQHLMQGTQWAHVLGWGLPLLLRRKLTPRLARIRWRLLAAAVVIAAAGLAGWTSGYLAFLALPVVSFVVLFISKSIAGVFGLGYLGDAARYLSPTPGNIEVRRAIRTATLTLLRGLHEDPLRRYERIVLVGHSLGSVIAYDAITWLWQELHHRVADEKPPHKLHLTWPAGEDHAPDDDPLHKLGETDGPENREFQRRQHLLWLDQKSRRFPWLITDLITLGSPLAHANVLLADSDDEFRTSVNQREFPQCPPTPDDARDRKLLLRRVGDSEEKVRILHHAAPFAVSRWTNIYFADDLIGGRLAPLFGSGIRDVELNSERGMRSHMRYWRRESTQACKALQDALKLNGDPKTSAQTA